MTAKCTFGSRFRIYPKFVGAGFWGVLFKPMEELLKGMSYSWSLIPCMKILFANASPV